jgi:hypothetical protein
MAARCIASLALLAALFVAGPAAAEAQSFFAVLAGGEEVPPVETRAHGLIQLRLEESGDELSFKLLVSRLAGVTQAHVHCGPAGGNGPVVLFLFGFEPGGVDVNGVLASGGIGEADVVARPDSAACPGGVEDLDDVLAQLRAGNAYVNVHTAAYPAGELRGQLEAGGPPAPATPATPELHAAR